MRQVSIVLLGLAALGALGYVCVQRHATDIYAALHPAPAIPPPPEIAGAPASPSALRLSLAVIDGKLALSGAVNSEATRRDLLDLAQRVFGTDNVIDALQIDPSSAALPKLDAATALIAAMRNIPSASVDIEGERVTLQGDVVDDAAKLGFEQLARDWLAVADLRNLLLVRGPATPSVLVEPPVDSGAASAQAPQPAETASTPADVTAPPPSDAAVAQTPEAQVESRIRDAIAGRRIEFAVRESTLTADARELLDELVAILQSEPSVTLEIAGHTDNQGEPQRKQALSEARAVAVKQYLVERGIEATRLRSVGYGDAQPIADNATPAGRRQNRRIEFHAQ